MSRTTKAPTYGRRADADLFARLPGTYNTPPVVAAVTSQPGLVCVSRDENDAKYDAESKRFRHTIDVYSHEPFRLQQVFRNYPGVYQGYETYIAVPGAYFAFQQLPLELRQSIYKFVFTEPGVTTIDHRIYTRRPTWATQQSYSSPDTRRYALLLTSRAIHNEAKEFLYSTQRFVAENTANLDSWFNMIGKFRKYITHLELKKAPVQTNRGGSIYKQLCAMRTLKYFSITLPATRRCSLEYQIDAHWKLLRTYLVSPGTSEEGALARLNGLHFRIDRKHAGFLDENGRHMKQITPEQNEWCKLRIRGHVREYFAN